MNSSDTYWKAQFPLTKREIFENNMGFAWHPVLPRYSWREFYAPRTRRVPKPYWRYKNRRAYEWCQREFAL